MEMRNIINGNFDKVHKSVGVLLHDSGFMRYNKLTEENYYYWWYEVEDVSRIDKRKFTYEWSDMQLTRKFDLLKKLLPYHRDSEDLCTVLNNALNIESALHDGVNMHTGVPAAIEVFDMHYANREVNMKQLTLF